MQKRYGTHIRVSDETHDLLKKEKRVTGCNINFIADDIIQKKLQVRKNKTHKIVEC